MTTVLHITAHMGGGVGRVIRNLIDCSCKDGEFEHQVNCFEYANDTTIAWAETSGIVLQENMAQKNDRLLKNLSAADIVHLHWWNHPLIYDFLAHKRLPEMRVVVWSHVNGHQAPHIFTRNLITWPDLFVLATPYSLRAPCIDSMAEGILKKRLRVVQSCAGIEHIKPLKPQAHKHFRVGYVGTVDYCKLNNRFSEMCLKADIPIVKYIVCGEDKDGYVAQDIARQGGAHKFEFRGWVDDISNVLAEFDVLGYPLDEQHYGTGEQVLIEAMAAGVPPVVLNNGVERFIVKDGVTGIVANGVNEYIAALEYLYHHPEKRKAMAWQARKDALRRFDIHMPTNAWHDIYADMVRKPKVLRPPYEFTRIEDLQDLPCRLFLQSLGDSETGKLYGEIATSKISPPSEQVRKKLQHLKPIFYSQTRGTVFHYRTFFPTSDGLNNLCRITQNNSPAQTGCNNAR